MRIQLIFRKNETLYGLLQVMYQYLPAVALPVLGVECLGTEQPAAEHVPHRLGSAVQHRGRFGGPVGDQQLRVQLERQHESSFPAGEYFQFFGLRLEHIELAKPDVIVMHPGPINRGRELSSEVADSQRSVILNQVENGISVRMAVLERIIGEQTSN